MNSLAPRTRTTGISSASGENKVRVGKLYISLHSKVGSREGWRPKWALGGDLLLGTEWVWREFR
jgi:hypothetical protein